MDSRCFRDLFYKALQLHRNKFSVDDNAIEQAIIALQNEYSPKQWKSNPTCPPVNYNDPAFRCAYLHKYASCHAALLQEVLLYMISLDISVLWDSFIGREPLKICCLGGGPGTDIIGLLSVFCCLNEFQNSTFHFTVVDCMEEWNHALMSVMEAAQSTQFQFLNSLSSLWLYLQADMLSHIPESVIDELRSADMVTMVKFVSAAASEVTPNMIRTVFDLLKPGALVFFIDNAGGGYYEMVSEQASACGLCMQYGPFQHVRFKDNVFRRKMFGFFSLSSTTITAQMWKKDLPVFWIPYEYHIPQWRYQARFYSRGHRNKPFSSKSKHGSGKHTNATKDESVSTVSLNSNDEHSQEIPDKVRDSSVDVKESCSISTDPPTKEKISWTSSHLDTIALSSESITSKHELSAKEVDSVCTSGKEPSTSKHSSLDVKKNSLESCSTSTDTPIKEKSSSTSNHSDNMASSFESNTSNRKLIGKEGEPVCTSGEEPGTSKHTLRAIEGELLCSSNEESSSDNPKPNTIEKSSKGKKHTDVLSCFDMQDLSSQCSGLRLQKVASSATSIEDKEKQTSSSKSLCEDTHLREAQRSNSMNDEIHPEMMKHNDLESHKLNSCCPEVLRVESSGKVDITADVEAQNVCPGKMQ